MPAGTPPAIVDRLNKECSAILTSAETQKLFLKQGAEVDYKDRRSLETVYCGRDSKFGPVIKEVGLTAQ